MITHGCRRWRVESMNANRHIPAGARYLMSTHRIFGGSDLKQRGTCRAAAARLGFTDSPSMPVTQQISPLVSRPTNS